MPDLEIRNHLQYLRDILSDMDCSDPEECHGVVENSLEVLGEIVCLLDIDAEVKLAIADSAPLVEP